MLKIVKLYLLKIFIMLIFIVGMSSYTDKKRGEEEKNPINKFIRLFYPFEKKEFVAYNSSEETTFDDSIAIGILGNNYEPVLFAKNLKLGCKWICIAFPNRDVRQTLIVDTLHTVSHIMVTEPYEYFATTLSVKDKSLNHRVYEGGNPDDEEAINYDVAFRGSYVQSDVHLYGGMKLSYKDSLYVMTTIEEAMDKANIKSPYIFSEEPSELALRGMCKFKDDLFVAYFLNSETEYVEQSDIMIVRNGKVIFWDTAYFGIDISIFRLKNQDYIYTSRAVNHAVAWDVYKLDGDKVENIYRMTMTD